MDSTSLVAFKNYEKSLKNPKYVNRLETVHLSKENIIFTQIFAIIEIISLSSSLENTKKKLQDD